jgi:molybdopterin converting factor small subunit
MGMSARAASAEAREIREAFPVPVEVISWVNQFVGGPGTGTVELAETVRPGETVGGVLRRLSGRHPRLSEALWDSATGELGSHIEVVVNDAVLGVRHSLDSRLEPGDRLALMGQYLGG